VNVTGDAVRLLAPSSVVGILGGTGPQGLGLATRLAASGLSVLLGSRSPDRAQGAAASIVGDVTGMGNAACARACKVALVAVPYAGHADLLAGLHEELFGKVVIDCVNPLGFDGKGAYGLDVPEGSACEQAQVILPGSRVVGAFHHLSAEVLLDPEVPEVHADVLVVGDDREATDLVQVLAERIPGVRGVYAGRLRNAQQVEALTANLISINRRYKVRAGIAVAGLD
jgi:8-hydroxy-5-deazaflavin:NADPH oxidoreductase